MSEQLGPDVTAAVSVLVRHGYDLSKLGIPGAPVRLATPDQVFKAIELDIINEAEARRVFGLAPRRGILATLFYGAGVALQVVVSSLVFAIRTVPRHG